jgi:hypothetical protein
MSKDWILVLNLVGIEKLSSRVSNLQELASEGGLARAVGSRDEDCFRRRRHETPGIGSSHLHRRQRFVSAYIDGVARPTIDQWRRLDVRCCGRLAGDHLRTSGAPQETTIHRRDG